MLRADSSFCREELIGWCEHNHVDYLLGLALKGPAWAEAQADTIPLHLLKIGVIVRIRLRRVLLQLSSAYP